jgi:YD repeat-containing protein
MKYFHRKFAIVKYSSYIYYIQKRLTMTIAQQLNIPLSEFPFSIKNRAGQEIYRETEINRWIKQEWDERGNKTYHEDSDGYWIQYDFDKAGNLIGQTESTGRWKRWKFNDKNQSLGFITSTGGWAEFEYNEAGEMIYHKNQSGVRLDLRPKVVVLTHAQIAEKLGIPVNLLKIAG